MAHTITSEANKIKVLFDKTIQGWTYDKQQLRFIIKWDYKDYASMILVPATAKNYSALMKAYADHESYIFTDSFLNDYQKELKQDQKLAIKRKLLKEKLSLETIRERPFLLEYSKDTMPNCPENELIPFMHQQLELEYAVRFPAFYSLDEMRLGKSRVAIERHVFLKKRKVINKSIVVCPSPLLYNWANEIHKWTDTNYHIISGSKKEKIEEINIMLQQNVDFFIINFEGISSIKEELLNFVDEKTNIIIDEFIKIKNPSAKRSRNLVDICNKTEYVMALCGTPVSQGSVDLFSPNLCVDKGKKYGFSYDRFIDKYFWRDGWKATPKKNTYKELSDKLYENSIRFRRKDVFDIPEVRFQPIPFDLPTKNQEVYNQMLQFALSELEGKEVTAPIILVQLLRLSQITSGFIKTPENKIVEFKEQPKLNALKEIIATNNGSQVLIWSRFINDIKKIATLLMQKNISFGCLVGSAVGLDNTKTTNNSPQSKLIDLIKPIDSPFNQENIKKAYLRKVKELHPDLNKFSDGEELKQINTLYNQINKFQNLDITGLESKEYDIPSNLIGTDAYTRQNIVDKFQAGNLQAIIGTTATGGMGYEMSKAESVIYYANDYSYINRKQSEDRTQSSKQKRSVVIYDLIANDTIDISILNVLMGKKSIADVITKDNIKNIAKGQK